MNLSFKMGIKYYMILDKWFLVENMARTSRDNSLCIRIVNLTQIII
jgi:hypothetical protein